MTFLDFIQHNLDYVNPNKKIVITKFKDNTLIAEDNDGYSFPLSELDIDDVEKIIEFAIEMCRVFKIEVEITKR